MYIYITQSNSHAETISSVENNCGKMKSTTLHTNERKKKPTEEKSAKRRTGIESDHYVTDAADTALVTHGNMSWTGSMLVRGQTDVLFQGYVTMWLIQWAFNKLLPLIIIISMAGASQNFLRSQ